MVKCYKLFFGRVHIFINSRLVLFYSLLIEWDLLKVLLGYFVSILVVPGALHSEAFARIITKDLWGTYRCFGGRWKYVYFYYYYYYYLLLILLLLTNELQLITILLF